MLTDQPSIARRVYRLLIGLLGPVWLPFWLLWILLQFLIGLAQHLLLDVLLTRFFRLPAGKLMWARRQPVAALLSLICLPLVLLLLTLMQAARGTMLTLVGLGNWQLGRPRHESAAPANAEPDPTPAAHTGRLLRVAACLAAGTAWLAIACGLVYLIARPMQALQMLRGPVDVVELSVSEQRPWWFIHTRNAFGQVDTDFATGLACIGLLLLIRWPVLPRRMLGWSGIRLAQFALRMGLVLLAGWYSLTDTTRGMVRLAPLFDLPIRAYFDRDLAVDLSDEQRDYLRGPPDLPLRLARFLADLYGPDLTANELLLTLAALSVALAAFVALFRLAMVVSRRGASIRAVVPFLASRLLERKLIAFFAVAAITLCTAMVLIVLSVLDGMVRTILSKSQGMLGEIVVDAGSDTGFTGYEQFRQILLQHPDIEAVTPVIYGVGVLRLPDAERVETVRIAGIDLPGKQAVVGFSSGLHFQQNAADPVFDPALLPDAPRERLLRNPPIGVILGTDVFFKRGSNREYNRFILPRYSEMVITLFPFTRRGDQLPPVSVNAMYVDDHQTGVYNIDRRQVYLDFHYLQKLLDMNASDDVLDEDTGMILPGRRARASQLQIRMKRHNGREPTLQDVYALRDELQDMWRYLVLNSPNRLFSPAVSILAWDEINLDVINAARKEKFMFTTLFCMISMVAVLLVFTLLYLIAMDKTRDVGVIKAVGGSNAAVAGIFLAYGGVIGLLGASIGLVAGWLFTVNINEIQDFLASLHPALRIWDPSVYVFERIPSDVNPLNAAVVYVAAVASSVAGAIVPAIRASRMEPTESLRYE